MPLWAVEPVQVHEGDGWTIVQGTSARSWTATVEASRQELLAANLSPLTDGWDGRLTVVAPGTTPGFEAVLGALADEFAATGALTWTAEFSLPPGEGAQPSSVELPQIITNPATTAGMPPDDMRLLITHEGVHAATDRLGLPAAGRAWVSEGLAEVVALATQPRHAQRLKDLVTDDCAALATLPVDSAFSGGIGGDAKLAEVSYARAWVLVSQLEQLLGREASRDEIMRLWRGDEPALLTFAELADASVKWCQSVKA